MSERGTVWEEVRKAPGDLFISNTFEGELNRDGDLFERGDLI